MKHTFRGLLGALALALILQMAAHAQEIKGTKAKKEIIAKARDRLQSSMLPGVHKLHCRLGCESLRAFYDSLWRATPETSAVPMVPFQDLILDLFARETSTLITDSLAFPPYEQGTRELARRIEAMEGYLTAIFGFWLHMDEMTFRPAAKNIRIRRTADGYIISEHDERGPLRAHLTKDYILTGVELATPDSVQGGVRTVFTRIGNRLRLDSLRLDVVRDGRAGFIAMAYTYTEVQGRLVPSAIAVKAEHILPLVNMGDEDFPIDETLLFSDYHMTVR
jgi:hypothetical protein